MAEQAQMTEEEEMAEKIRKEELNKKINGIYEKIISEKEKLNVDSESNDDVKQELINFIKDELKVLNKDEHKSIILKFLIMNICNQYEANIDAKITNTKNHFDNFYYSDDYNGNYVDNKDAEKINKVAETIYISIVCVRTKPEKTAQENTIINAAENTIPEKKPNNQQEQTFTPKKPLVNKITNGFFGLFKPSNSLSNVNNIHYYNEDKKIKSNYDINNDRIHQINAAKRKGRGGKSKKTHKTKTHKKKTQKRKR